MGILENMKERAIILSDLYMVTDVINLLRKIQKRGEEKEEAIESIMNDWLKTVEDRVVAIFEECKEHLYKWTCVKMGKIEANYVYEFFDSEIRKLKRVKENSNEKVK